MDRVEEIEIAIASLPPEEYRRLADWFRAREQTLWDDQMDRDSVAGKLEFLFREAENESAQGTIRARRTQRCPNRTGFPKGALSVAQALCRPCGTWVARVTTSRE